jgi:UDP-2-acetamido-2-deoxy-ribo-hexuluronate aminotransferase
MDQAGIERVQQRIDRSSVFAQYTIFTDQREIFQEKLSLRGIPTSIHYPIPLNRQKAYTNDANINATPISQRISEAVISLPMGPDLNIATQDEIVDAIRSII